ncbi:hypothetical protein VaNZ11_010574 [Volvox africanus]|uniref:Uncharacterized protein n=1 Tax=Volvox africanus TaxID=51714 RepID=A0ABQ5SBC4_9CHLO|nr:hypothetical protein VaNZ11_010574 [Volvox africanus]
MLRHLAARRLLPQTAFAAPIRRTLIARPVAPCSWSKRDEVLSNWEALRANPEEWYDNRSRKNNPRAPDFVRRDNRSVAIWIDGRDTPEWYEDVLEQLDSRQMGQGRGERTSNRPRSDRRDSSAEYNNWLSLRESPEEWFDNRSRKTNPRAPDFRRKDDRSVALWLDSYNAPEWIEELLQELDARQSQRAAGYSQQPQEGGEMAPQQYMEDKRAAEMAKWESLRSNPELWFDNRRSKTNPKAPDFKRKDDRSVALWLSSYQLPEYIDELLAELDARFEQRMSGQQQRQQDYQAYPEQQAYADYPQQQQQQYQQGEVDPRDARQAEDLAKWESLRDHPEEWFDNRYSKPNPKWPDFRRRDDRSVVLWLSSRSAPEWINELLPKLDVLVQQREAARQNRGYSTGVEVGN